MADHPVERELREPVDLCLPDGRLNPAAVGWSRRPLHRCNLPGSRWGRRKRWDYWCVTSGSDHLLGLTFANLDYLGLATVLFVDLATGEAVEHGLATPLALGFGPQSETADRGLSELDCLGLQLAMAEQPDGTRLTTSFRKPGGQKLSAEIFVERPPGYEGINVVIPWQESQFQLTSKQPARPARGVVTAFGREYRFGAESPAYGCLDYGRGIWPYATTWNWASAAGVVDGRTVGIQLGGQWTDGTGMTENGLVVDGEAIKLGERVVFRYDRRDFRRPWRIHTVGSGRLSLHFTPIHLKRSKVPLLVASSQLHLCFGHFNGYVTTADGVRLEIDPPLFGWAEEMITRW